MISRQSHAKDPEVKFLDPDHPDEEIKSFRYIKHVLYNTPLTTSVSTLQWKENVNFDVFEKFPNIVASPVSQPLWQVSNGSYLARIRCVKLKVSDTLPNIRSWVLADMSWPDDIKVSVNEKPLEISRRSSKNPAIDITSMLKPGQNKLSATASGLRKDCIYQWLIGLEVVEVVDAAAIRKMLISQSLEHCRERILDKLRPKDLEIELVKPQTVIDMTDPFTLRIFDTPARGKDCLHDQCFDLDTFLQTRGSALKIEPCQPEEFRCPICKGDVRPHLIVVDGFLASIRSELEKKARLDVTAVILHESGDWKIKEEETITKDEEVEVLRVLSSNRKRGSMESSYEKQPVSKKAKSTSKEKVAAEVIVLDDD